MQQGRSLTELPGIGPHLEKIIRHWIDHPPATPKPPEIRKGFLTLMQARAIIRENPSWLGELKGDLQNPRMAIAGDLVAAQKGKSFGESQARAAGDA